MAAEPAAWNVSDGTQAATEADMQGQYAKMPASAVGRMIAGTAALLVPRTVAQAAGLVDIGGGRGFWAAVDIDTMFVDALCLYVLFACARMVRRRPRDISAAFVLVALHSIVMISAAAYTVSNFGTLFRIRGFMIAELAFLPILLTRTTAPSDEPPRGEA